MHGPYNNNNQKFLISYKPRREHFLCRPQRQKGIKDSLKSGQVKRGA
jgi:hypothetical protein